jgi:hypothetical protein
MSTIAVGTTTTTAFVVTGDSSGELVIKTGTGAGTTALTIDAAQNVAFANPPSISGALGVASGGTGVTATPTNGQLLIGNGTGFTLAALTAGNGMTITNSAGGILLSAAGLPTMNIVSGTTQTATANNQYVLINAAATVLTLPASPAAGAVVWVTVGNQRTDNVVARNGEKINSIAEDMVLDIAYAAIQLRYVNSTIGWAFS